MAARKQHFVSIMRLILVAASFAAVYGEANWRALGSALYDVFHPAVVSALEPPAGLADGLWSTGIRPYMLTPTKLDPDVVEPPPDAVEDWRLHPSAMWRLPLSDVLLSLGGELHALSPRLLGGVMAGMWAGPRPQFLVAAAATPVYCELQRLLGASASAGDSDSNSVCSGSSSLAGLADAIETHSLGAALKGNEVTAFARVPGSSVGIGGVPVAPERSIAGYVVDVKRTVALRGKLLEYGSGDAHISVLATALLVWRQVPHNVQSLAQLVMDTNGVDPDALPGLKELEQLLPAKEAAGNAEAVASVRALLDAEVASFRELVVDVRADAAAVGHVVEDVGAAVSAAGEAGADLAGLAAMLEQHRVEEAYMGAHVHDERRLRWLSAARLVILGELGLPLS